MLFKCTYVVTKRNNVSKNTFLQNQRLEPTLSLQREIMSRPNSFITIQIMSRHTELCRDILSRDFKKDRLLWKGDKNGIFFVKANFARLEGRSVRIVPMNLLWKSCVPSKVNFFAWEVWWGKFLTIEKIEAN